MSGPGWTYTPSQAVQAAHAIPHVYTTGKIYTGNFNLTNINYSPTATTGYLPTIFLAPIVLLALGLISIIFMNVLWFCRCFSCCRWLKCAPTEEAIENDPLKVVKSRKVVWYWFVFWIFVALLADHAIYFGNADADKAFTDGASAFGTLAGMFQDIATTTSDMSTQVSLFSDAAAYSQKCSSINGVASQLSGPIASISSLVGTVPDQLVKVQTYLGNDAKAYKNEIAYVFYAVILAVILSFPLAAYFLRSKCAFYFLMTLAWLIVVALTVICAIIMIFVIVFGDFCMDPARSILTGITSTSSAGSFITYYTTCTGNSPFASYLDLISSQIGTLKTTLGNSAAQCANSANDAWTTKYYAQAQGSLTQLQKDFSAIKASTSCGSANTINIFYNQAMNQGVCGNFFNGLFKIWVSEYVVSAALFFTLICSSVLYQYFGPAWNLKAAGSGQGDYPDEENPTMQSPEYELTEAEYAQGGTSAQQGQGQGQDQGHFHYTNPSHPSAPSYAEGYGNGGYNK